ncbi:hypothetical protein JZ751_010502 [Albula glossodonta]|uniref:CLOCK-interacting pacemaker n=1 Tax=Albula glossodonta TaxID=121402 RepID=A0A8T2MV82_9TELE|nr:hypothetical protein JZ751_014413 [Albula glossodonta]KAG9344815.1 hypothetical protein JZ751_010502 [Albula glossodonta]
MFVGQGCPESFSTVPRCSPEAGDTLRLREETPPASTAAVTMRDRARTHSHQKLLSDAIGRMRMEGSRPESERDSGFSEGISTDGGSEHHTVLEQTGLGEAALGAQPGAQASQVAVMGAPYSGLSPVVFMNNILLKQPTETPPSPKPWGFEVLPQPQVVFLQPMVSADSAPLQRSVPTKRRRSKKYLPILKSYPKIAPYPGDSSSEQSSSGCSEQSSTASGHRGRRHGNRQQSCLPDVNFPTSPALPSLQAASPKHCPPPPESEAAGNSTPVGDQQVGLLNNSQECNSSAPAAALAFCMQPMEQAGMELITANEVQADGMMEDCDSKRKRFCNTYNILSQSGLLDITLRTKELIRQNRNSQGQLERLQAQASLFLEAVQSGDPKVWTKLQQVMMEAGPETTEEGKEHAQNDLVCAP